MIFGDCHVEGSKIGLLSIFVLFVDEESGRLSFCGQDINKNITSAGGER
jgi:hypothetical protein